MNVHIEFAVTPTKDVYDKWYQKTGNRAKKIKMIKEKVIL